LEIRIKTFSEDGLKYFAKMESLKNLQINQDGAAKDLIVHIAGKIPNLQRLEFAPLNSLRSYEFAQLYEKFYPGKHLTFNLLE